MAMYKKQKNEVSDSTAYITEIRQTMWSLLTNTIPHGRTIMCMVTLATEASMMSVGHSVKTHDLGKHGQRLTDDFVTRLKNEFATNGPNVVFSYIPFQDDHTERLVEMCSLEMSFLENVNGNDKVIIIPDTRHTQRWSERQVDPMLCQGDLAFFCNCPVTLEHLRLWAHEVSHEMCVICKQSNLRPFSVRSLKTNILLDVLSYVSQVQKRTKPNNITMERLTKFCEIKTWKKEEMLWEKPIEKLIYLNRCLSLVTQRPRKNVWHLGFVFLAELALRSDDYIETCDIDRRKHSCRCYAARAPQDYVNAAKTFRC